VRSDPWRLKTPAGTSEYTIHCDDSLDPPALVCQLGKTTLSCYIPPLMEELGLDELEHNPRNNRMRAV
jgi:hypothetical protein